MRYIIDYWDAPPVPGKAASMHLDVRPALDSVGAVWDRCKMAMRSMASAGQPMPAAEADSQKAMQAQQQQAVNQRQ